jgi:chromosome partitioning protein
LLATIELVRDHLNPHLAIDGVVLTMADARTNLSAEVEAEARRHLDGIVYDTVIPRSVRLSEAPSHGRSIATYAPGSRGGMAYVTLASEFRSRNARHAAARSRVGIPIAPEADVAVLS